MMPSADTTYGPDSTSLYFDSLNPHDMFNVKSPALSAWQEYEAPPGLARATGPGATDPEPLWSPHNPMFWFGAVLAATFGLVAVSTSVRIGPARAAVALGKK